MTDDILKERLRLVENFFLHNLNIKSLMVKLSPDNTYAYSQEAMEDYAEKLYQGLKTLHSEFLELIKIFPIYKDIVNKLFKGYQEELLYAGYDYNKLTNFYRKSLSTMDMNLVRDVRKELKGYYIWKNEMGLVTRAKTVNELLHVFHSILVNDENFYQVMPKIDGKKETYEVNYYGREDDFSKAIFENFPMDLDCGNTDILSLPNNKKIMIMIRDKGHALTIEIDQEPDGVMVRYFIPKVCNYIMVQKINEVFGGLTINKDASYASGSFKSENIIEDLRSLISMVPTDDSMFIEGGLCYETNLKIS